MNRRLTQFFKLILFFSALSLQGYTQSVVSELRGEDSNNSIEEMTFAEKVVVVSRNKRIIVLTNTSQNLSQGDFVTLLLGTEPAARALVVKSQEGKAGIKIIKTYSEALRSRLVTGMGVRVLKGDESQLNASSGESPLSIQSESDLYSDDNLIDIEGETHKKRVINNNNIIGFGLGYFRGIDNNKDSENYGQYSFSYAYQSKDDLWLEFMYGYTTAKRFPATDLSTTVHNFVFKLKYSFELPYYSYLMPYAGVQFVLAKSKEAGVAATDTIDAATQAQLDRELELVDEMEKTAITAGVTYLKRFVPGWFFTANVGMDIIGVGLGIEF
ncbi:MAG: hypothetical protein H6621_07140 [Halobacteriovoraceae bacterium]|nr:hypothetical protein [Halobacteriovoraceae bacterium]